MLELRDALRHALNDGLQYPRATDPRAILPADSWRDKQQGNVGRSGTVW